MRKFTALLLILMFLLPVISVNVSATENIPSEKEEIIDLACQFFPEYENIIRDQTPDTTTYARTTAPVKVITKETRPISDNEEITYYGLSDGTALLALTSESFKYSYTNPSSEIGAGAISYTVTVKVTCSASGYSGVFTLSNIKYTISQSTYDSINSTGSPSTSGQCKYSDFRSTSHESASGSATIYYKLAYNPDGNTNWRYCKSVDFELFVGNNRMEVELTPYES